MGKTLCQVTVWMAREAEEPVTALMEAVLGQTPSVYEDLRRTHAKATVYLENQRAWDSPKEKALRSGLRTLRESGLNVGTGRIRVTALKAEDWAESWKKHFKPLEIGSRLLVKPSWSRRRARAGQEVIVLDPGLSFGTGHHPTTRFCLRQLAAYLDRAGSSREAPSLLDMGCGSGILAIAAAKLGYGKVDAFDYDAEAIRVAETNARENGVRSRLRLARKDVARCRSWGLKAYDVVAANLTSDVLLTHREAIMARLKPGGWLVLAGILAEQYARVKAAYERDGRLRERRSRKEGEWRSGSFGFGA